MSSAFISFLADFWNVTTVVYFAAVFVFLSAHRLIRSVVVFYVVGVLIGLSLSFLLFGHLLQRIIPFPSVTKIPLFFGGWPLSFYVYYLVWTNSELIFRHYKLYAVLYLCFFGFLSLAVCYRVGPPSDIRSLNLIVWLLQLSSLSALYFFSLNYFRGIASVCFLLIVSFWWKYRRIICSFAKVTQHKISTFIYGPQPRKLLTEAQYQEEARMYTQIELDRLRQHLQSQQMCDTLRFIWQLHTPNRTSSFVTGNSEHISPDEKRGHFELYGCSDAWRNGNDHDETDEYVTDEE